MVANSTLQKGFHLLWLYFLKIPPTNQGIFDMYLAKFQSEFAHIFLSFILNQRFLAFASS